MEAIGAGDGYRSTMACDADEAALERVVVKGIGGPDKQGLRKIIGASRGETCFVAGGRDIQLAVDPSQSSSHVCGPKALGCGLNAVFQSKYQKAEGDAVVSYRIVRRKRMLFRQARGCCWYGCLDS